MMITRSSPLRCATLLPLLVAFAFPIAARAALVPNTFVNGEPADADAVNENFNTVAERVIAPGGPVAINCGTTPTALATALAKAAPGTTFTITGTCTGPITIRTPFTTLMAATSGVDGIAANVTGGFAVLTVQAFGAAITGLKLNGGSGTNNSYGLTVTNGSADVTAVTVVSSQFGVVAGRGGTARLIDNTSIITAEAYDSATLRFESGNSGFAIAAGRGASVDNRQNGLTVSALGIRDAAHFRTATSMTITGPVDFSRGASGQFSNTLSVTGTGGFVVQDGSNVVANLGTVATNLDVRRRSSFLANGTAITGTNVNVYNGSSLELRANATRTGNMNASLNSVIAVDTSTVNGNSWITGTSSYNLNNSTLNGGAYVAIASSMSAFQGSITTAAASSGWNDGHLHIHIGATLNLNEAALSGYVNFFAGSTAWINTSQSLGGATLCYDQNSNHVFWNQPQGATPPVINCP